MRTQLYNIISVLFFILLFVFSCSSPQKQESPVLMNNDKIKNAAKKNDDKYITVHKRVSIDIHKSIQEARKLARLIAQRT